MKKATLAIITRKNGTGTEILLGRKQGSPEIGEGTLNGPGGKKEPDESLLDCLLREVEEEVGIQLDPSQATKVSIVTFYAADEPSFEVHIYRADVFSGEPHETESMVPGWHSTEAIPYERMLESDRAWFPKLLAGERFNAIVYYKEKARGYIDTKLFPFEDHD